MYSFMLDRNFAEFLEDGFEWLPKSTKQPHRGLADVVKSDGTVVISAAQRVKYLEICLGRVAGYAPVISRATIVQKCRSFKEIFQKLRAHYGFALTGSSILDVVAIQKQGDESYEDLFQRIQAQVDSSLLSSDTELEHHGQKIEEDEQMTPTLDPSQYNFLEKNIFDLQITIDRVHPIQILSRSDYCITTHIM